MSTRSRIGIIRGESEDGAPLVESIYCHFDGYPEGVGQTLLDHWRETAKVEKLIALGDISSLGSIVGLQHDFDSHLKTWPNWTLVYGRDRGEKDCGSVTHPIDQFPDYGQEAEYVFNPQDGIWRVRSETLNPLGWNTVPQWQGWITIPEALELVAADQ
jgi:hypothetical protein